MNYPTRTDPAALDNGWNQNPDLFAAELRSDTDAVKNKLRLQDHRIDLDTPDNSEGRITDGGLVQRDKGRRIDKANAGEADVTMVLSNQDSLDANPHYGGTDAEKKKWGWPGLTGGAAGGAPGGIPHAASSTWKVLKKFAKFVGPGWMVSVAYIDPGNYATDVAAGSSYRFRLLVMILVSNIIAIFLQSLCVKLGSVTGLNLAEMTKKHCPPWLNYMLFFFAEAGIIATDMAEVIGTAIALNLLLHIPLVAGCAISILDVLLILMFYRPGNSMRPGGSLRGLRVFEFFVAFLVLGVVICFAIELSLVDIPNVRELFRGYLPSRALIERDGLLQACGILGATVMPHSLYLGSGLVQPRLYEYDQAHEDEGDSRPASTEDGLNEKYRPSLAAIRYCLKYSIIDLSLSLFTFALFVNSAILIVAGASLYDPDSTTDTSLFDVFHLLQNTIGKAAGIIFALALLLSGMSAGIVCTIAGQFVWLGQMQMPMKPWVQRLMTRSIAITPSIIVAGAVGKDGVSAALEGTQIALSVILPFVSAPLIWFTCRSKYMMVPARDGGPPVNMRNNWLTATVAVLFWLLIVVMNVASWALQGSG